MKYYRIQKRASLLSQEPDADVTLRADSFEKALTSYGAVNPKQWYSIGAIRRYEDQNKWFYDIWRDHEVA